MSSFLSQITVLVIIVLIAGASLLIMGVFPGPNVRNRGCNESENTPEIFGRSVWKTGKDNNTNLMSMYSLQQFDTRSGRIVRNYTLKEIDSGSYLSIGRDKSCDITINESSYIGRIHAYLCKDKDGWFIQDNNSQNGLYPKNHTKRVEEVDLSNGGTFYLANVKFVLSISNPFKEYDNDTTISSATKIQKVGPKIGVRRSR